MCAAEPALCGVCAECSQLPPQPHPHSPPQLNSHVCVFLAKPLGPFCPEQQTGGHSVSSHTLSVSKKSGAIKPPSGRISKLHHGLMSSRDEFQDRFVEVPVFLCVLCEGSLSNFNEPFIMVVPSLTKRRQNTLLKQKDYISRLHPFEFERQSLLFKDRLRSKINT